jgi:RNA recognition motif-containing protein
MWRRPWTIAESRARELGSSNETQWTGRVRVNLSYSTTVEELRALATQFGRVQSCKIQVAPETGTSRGFGFVYCRTPDDARDIIQALNGHEFGGRTLFASLLHAGGT